MVTRREARHTVTVAQDALDPALQNNSQGGDDSQDMTGAPPNPLYPTDNQFAGLVEAATAAAGQWSQGEDVEIPIARHGSIPQQFGAYASHLPDMPSDMSHPNGTGHHYPDPAQDYQGNQRSNSRKRKRGGSTSPPPDNFDNSLEFRDPPPQQSLSQARDAGVHSAAALFRRPSSTSKKYTRPPMAALFGSLQLTAENFLHLQAAAKSYMLDEAHPERRDGCVGQRGKGDGDMVKLTLWHCVETFLDQEGNGNRFFSDEVMEDGVIPRTLIWPRAKEEVIKATVPLCRRMVTNERQRVYAVETRKGGGTQKKRKVDGDSHLPMQQHDFSAYAPSPQRGYDLPENQTLSTADPTTLESPMNGHVSSLILQIVPVRSSRRLGPSLTLPSESVPDIATLIQQIHEHLQTNGVEDTSSSLLAQVHLPDGLVKVGSDGEWAVALMSASKVEWMEGIVKVIVQLS